MGAAVKRKLIDIKPGVFESLQYKAQRKSISLKRYIEELIEKDAAEEGLPVIAGVTDPRILRLIGIAKPKNGETIENLEDERLQYILSK